MLITNKGYIREGKFSCNLYWIMHAQRTDISIRIDLTPLMHAIKFLMFLSIIFLNISIFFFFF